MTEMEKMKAGLDYSYADEELMSEGGPPRSRRLNANTLTTGGGHMDIGRLGACPLPG